VKLRTILAAACVAFCLLPGPAPAATTGAAATGASGPAAVSGELRKWHPVALTFSGPETAEAAAPNPFRDFRLAVTFSSGGRTYVVPGYYAADGNAANTGAAAGNKWRVHFTPDQEGEWTWTASFRTGPDVALSSESAAGKPAAFDGATGTLKVGPTDKAGRDLRGQGMLQYVGEHYLRFAQTGEYFLKGGADSPENFLGYADFDQTPKGKHRYAPHTDDWKPGDPSWAGGRGRGIIGALNYLASKGMNSVYFLTMNVRGDGKDVWPWTDENERFRFDCSKLDQWEIVFSHMDRLGIMLHVLTQETENDQLLDGGDLGPERTLYYRELVARFGHHLAVIWNLGEENTNTDDQRKAFAKFFKDVDPYKHPVVVHTFPGKQEAVYTPLLGYACFDGPSLQTNQTHAQTVKWVDQSAAAGRKWFVSLDEIGPANTGVKPDADDPGHDEVRHKHLWGNLMAGGAGCEWYFGYKFPNNDLNCEDWRSRDRMWDQTRHALEFFRGHLPFAKMKHADELTPDPDDYCFALPGEVYAVYLPAGGAADLDLGAAAAAFAVAWYNPREGGPLQTSSVAVVKGPGKVSLGRPPADPSKDWVVLVKVRGGAPAPR